MPSSRGPKQPPTKLADGRFELVRKLGGGCFGEVWLVEDKTTGKTVAAKCENLSASVPQLEHESDTLQFLQKPTLVQGFAEWFHFEKKDNFNILVMEVLGRSLEDRVQSSGGKFPAVTTALIAEQVVRRIEYLHSKGIVHRDIKPENFMFGKGNKEHIVYLIDFGLSKKYWDQKGGHVGMRQNLSLTGTARYASINAHKGFQQSRRDDLEAIGHMFMYFLRGALPWSGMAAKSKAEKYNRIRAKKEETELKVLCDGHPIQFMQYLEYARKLKFTERPDYDKLAKWMRAVRASSVPPPVSCSESDYFYVWYEKEAAWKALKDSGPVPLERKVPSGKVPGPNAQPDDVSESKTSGCGCSPIRIKCSFWGSKQSG